MTTPTKIQDLTKIAQGREAEIFAWEDGQVLRLPFRKGPNESVGLETLALKAAAAGGFRVPMYHGEVTVEGRVGQILERLDGPDLLAGATTRPWALRGLSFRLGRLHATMHGVKAPEGLPSLLGIFRAATPETVTEHQRPFLGRIQPILERLGDGDMLTHGDFHPGNVMMHKGEPVVIDWPNAMAAPPEADVARTLMLLDIGELPDDTPWHARALTAVGRGVLRRWYFQAYQKQRPLDATTLDDWYTAQLLARLGEEVTPGEMKQIRELLEERLG